MGRRAIWVGAFAIGLMGTTPLGAQEVKVFDQFNLKLEGSWVRVNTMMRIDSKTLGEGAQLNFEDDLGLDEKTLVPSAAFEWQFSTKHRLALRWQDIDRSSSHQTLTELQIGDEIIPVDTDLGLAFEIETWALDYTYYPWIRERWSAGFGFGFRVLDFTTVFRANGLELEADGTVTAPLPYFNFEYRRLLGSRWRFKAGLGWLALKVDQYSGGQWIGRASMEHQTFKNLGFGLGLNFSTVDFDADGDEFMGAIDLDIDDVSVFVRFHF